MNPLSSWEVLIRGRLLVFTSGERVGLPGFTGLVDSPSFPFLHKRLSGFFVFHKQLQIGSRNRLLASSLTSH